MLAYHNDASIKNNILAQLQAHYDADEIIKGCYWENGKGCAVGCTIHGMDHALYESKLGIPELLAQLEDCIFEGLPNGTAKQWPIRFTATITTGADLSRVGWQFLHWNITENLVLKDSDDPETQKAIVQCRQTIKQCGETIFPLAQGGNFDARAAESAARAAESAAESAVSAASAARAAWSAARAAWSAASAARAAWSAARAASAVSAAARAAESAAASAAYIKMADKLIELIEAAPMGETDGPVGGING